MRPTWQLNDAYGRFVATKTVLVWLSAVGFTIVE